MNACHRTARQSHWRWATWGLALLAAVLAAGCRRSRSAPAPLATAVIGPEGGEVTVANGAQSGLRLVVPAGAVASPVEIRVYDDQVQPPAGILALSTVPQPGFPLRIEPNDLVLEQTAVLTLPYLPQVIGDTAPGNVRVQQENAFTTRGHDPSAVDVVEGRLDIAVRTFGRFQVVRGPRATLPADYLPAVDQSVTLTGGYRFVIEEALAAPGGPIERLWRVEKPGSNEALRFVVHDLVGRRSDSGNWNENWAQPYSPWAYVYAPTSVPFGMTMPTTIVPLTGGSGSSGGNGQITVYGTWQFAEPQFVGGRLLYDVVRLQVWLAWDRPDLGVGQRTLSFVFAVGEGLLSLSDDAATYTRVE
jgi:hypothetical protein